jgi:hypothetical protein
MIIEGVDLAGQSTDELLRLHHAEFERGVFIEMTPEEFSANARLIHAVEAALVARGAWEPREDA